MAAFHSARADVPIDATELFRCQIRIISFCLFGKTYTALALLLR